jgi:tripeptide aminopeptidase
MQINRERLVQSFFALTAIDSPSSGSAHGDELKRRLLALGFTVSEDSAGETIGGSCGNLYAVLRGGGVLPPLLLCAHMDTVQPAQDKRAVLESDGTIRSAGDTVLGADDVSAISAILEAVQTLIEHNALQRDVEVLFTVSEETYGTGAMAFDCSVIRSKEAYVPDFDGVHGSGGRGSHDTFVLRRDYRKSIPRGVCAGAGRERHFHGGARHRFFTSGSSFLPI